MPQRPSNDLPQLAMRLRQCAQQRGHRAVMVLSGEAQWCRHQAATLLEGSDSQDNWWLGQAPLPLARSLDWNQARSRLGMECAALVVDAFEGFDAEGFGALSGTVRAGGVLLLLTPPLDDWPSHADAQLQRFVLYPFSAGQASGHFLRRLVQVLRSQAGITLVQQGQPLPPVPDCDKGGRPTGGDGIYATAEQRQAVEAIRQLAHGHPHRPLVLSADRGRGKSAALGIAAAQLLHQGEAKVIVTAPRIDAAAQVFAHAATQLPGCEASRGRVLWQGQAILFVPPDALLQTPHPGRLLLVDEAAAIPTPILEQLLERHARTVFATTIHGYEGTGRGFAVRFQKVLSERAPGWKGMHLSEPVRWAQDDPLEQFSFAALLLDAEPVDEAVVREAAPDNCRFEQIESAQLVADETALAELFGLLVLAHYRTSPNDLRQLLDGPQQSLFVLRHDGHIVATALVVREGELPAELAEEVYMGRRRVQGHLMAQSLANHAGFAEAAQLRAARVVRIAVHPALQGRGLGSLLLQQVEQVVRQQGCDYFGASFGATASLLSFWLEQAFMPVRVGLSREASSGVHGVMVMKPLSETGEQLYRAVRERFAELLPELLAEPLHDLDVALSELLLASTPPRQHDALGEQDRRDLASFAYGLRGYELCMVAIRKLVLQAMNRESHWGRLEPAMQQLVVSRVIQRLPWPQVVSRTGLSGRKEAQQRLREAVAQLLTED